jgi:hypothetical protein
MTLTIAFILLTAIILWFVIGARGQWSLKATCIALTLYFSLSLSQSLSSITGWPTTDKIPEQFEIHWALIEEPNKATYEKGRMFIWLTPSNMKKNNTVNWFMSFYTPEEGSPRAYSVPYSRDNHEKIDGVLEQLKNGQRVMGGKGVKRGKGEGEGEGDGDGKNGQGDGTGGGSLSNSPELYFYPLPPPKLPKK